MSRKIVAYLTPFVGVLFIIAYIRSATVDVVYTDYIRLINSYLENVFSIRPYMQLDILTRTPVNYIQRIVNVVLFSYSTWFDMMLGAIFLGAFGLVLAKYMLRRDLSIWTMFLIYFLLFSLNKWEMITNGTGWVHFAAFASFVYYYMLYDAYVYNAYDRSYERKLYILPWLSILLVAGPYSAIFALSIYMVFAFGIIFNKLDIKRHAMLAANILFPMLLYIFSKVNSIEEHAGSTNLTIGEVWSSTPTLFVRLFVKSFASVLISEELIRDYALSDISVLCLGMIVISAYIYAIYVFIRYKLYEDTVLPLCLIFSGIASHILVLSSRWIFLKDSYGMSSRYALQYQIGIIGIVLVIALYRRKKSAVKPMGNLVLLCFLLIFIVGNYLTNTKELEMAKYRKENFERIREVSLSFEKYPDEELSRSLQYHDGARVRKALVILRDRGLNIYHMSDDATSISAD